MDGDGWWWLDRPSGCRVIPGCMAVYSFWGRGSGKGDGDFTPWWGRGGANRLAYYEAPTMMVMKARDGCPWGGRTI